MDAQTVLRRAPHVTFETVADEAILIDLNTGTYFSLNPVGTDFWQLLDGRQTIQAHAQTIADKYNEKTAAYVAALATLTPTNHKQIAALAEAYHLEETLVREQATAVAGPNGREQAMAIANDFQVDTNLVLDDLLEIAQRMAADKLVEAI